MTVCWQKSGAMNPKHILWVAIFVGVAACSEYRTQQKLDDLSWGQPFKGEYDDVLARAKWVLEKEFPRGFDPDKSNEDDGDFWTVWDHKVSMWYRETTRARAHLKIEEAGEGEVRLGVAVVTQINDNIDNPHSIEEARWVKTSRDAEWAVRIEEAIARRYLKAKPSGYFEEVHRSKEKNRSMRPDLVDRYKDVDLTEDSDARDTKSLPPLKDKKDD